MLKLPFPGYVRLYSGAKVSANDGVPLLADMAVALPRELRYSGNSVEPWPVALHSFVAADLAPDPLKIYMLIHDVAEVVGGDVPRPMKTELTSLAEDEIFDRVCVANRLHILTDEEHQQVKHYDNRALMGELWTDASPRTLRFDYLQYERDAEAEFLVQKYMREFPIEECMKAYGKAGKEFVYRLFKYERLYRLNMVGQISNNVAVTGERFAA